MSIHPTALVSREAEISPTAEIGAYAVVEGRVRIGAGCRVMPHAQIVGEVELGEGCKVGRGAVIGEDPQDHSFRASVKSGVVIGAGTVIREHVTVHRGRSDGGVTRVGEGNYLMVGSHLGHDVEMGDGNVLANGVLIAGHCVVGSHVFLGGGTVVHQFVRIGDYAMAQGNSSLSMDVPPFTMVGQLNVLFGLNVVGLRRAGFSQELRTRLKQVYKKIYRSGKNRGQALDGLGDGAPGEVGQFVAFFRGPSKKGICGPAAV